MTYSFFSDNARSLFLSLTALSCFSISNAAPVSQQRAEAVARQFVQSHGARFASSGMKKAAPRLMPAKDIVSKNSAYYVFNVGADDGFVVVSGDDKAEPVLGYSGKGHLEASRMPDNMKAWLDMYDNEIASSGADDFLPMKAPAHSSVVKNNISTLLSCTWGQEQPYYDLVPGKNPVGCVATAIGQIMQYHKWPTQTTEEIPSYTYGGVKYDALPPTTFNWDIIADNYENYYDKDSRAEVAKLMQYLGYSVKMQYTNGSSGTYNELIPYALSTYFGYPDVRMVSRMDYSLSEWEDLVYKELSTSGPVLYTAQGNLLQGHAFVCDGYEGDGYFHFNWGWYGDLDGYFKLSAFNVSNSNISQLNWKHNIFTGMHRPDAGIAAGAPLRLISQGCSTEDDGRQYTVKWMTDEYGPIKVFDKRTAVLPKVADMEYTFGVFKDGKLLSTLDDYAETKEQVLTNSFSREVKIYISPMLDDGDYELRAVSREKGTGVWQEDAGGDLHHISFHIENKTLVTKSYFTGRDLKVNSVAYAGKQDGRYMYTLDITNNGYQYDGSLFFMRTVEDSKSQEASFLMQPKEHRYARVGLNRALTGGDSLKVSLDFMGMSLVYNDKLDSLTSQLSATVEPINIADGRINGGYFGFKANVTNTGDREYHGGIGWRLYRKSDDKLIYEQSYDTDLKPGESIDGEYMVPINPLTFYKSYANKEYVVKLVGYGFRKDANGNWVDAQELYSTDPAMLKTGVVYYNDKGEVISAVPATETVQVPEDVTTVDLQYTAGDVKTVKGNSNPNCLYVTYFRDLQPEGLDAFNYAKSDQAENLKLVAGKGFYSPVGLTAQNVEFTYTVEDEKWQTLTFPFDVDVADLEADGLFVKEYVGEENGTVYFDDAEKVIAWKPLLVAGKSGKRTLKSEKVYLAKAQTGMTEAENYWFCMTTAALDGADNVYAFSQKTMTFTRNDNKVQPFGAYFKPTSDNVSPAATLRVKIEGKQPGFDAISTVRNGSASEVVERYSVTGCAVGSAAKGVVIERHADGTVTKTLRR